MPFVLSHEKGPLHKSLRELIQLRLSPSPRKKQEIVLRGVDWALNPQIRGFPREIISDHNIFRLPKFGPPKISHQLETRSLNPAPSRAVLERIGITR